jgi:hypothetical protein
MQPDDIWVIVVDTVDDHLYKADLFTRTLEVVPEFRTSG